MIRTIVFSLLSTLVIISCSNVISDYGDQSTKVATPTFSPSEGTYYHNLNIEISCSTDGAIIHYTTDGSEPTTSSTVYSSQIPVSGVGTAVTIKSIAVKIEMENSDSSAANYFISGKIAQNAVGATDSTSLRTLDYTPDDMDSIFVSKLTGNDSTGIGTQANPVASINKAITLCDAQHQKVVILDSETYEEEGFEFTGNVKGLYAAIGKMPVYKPVWEESLRDSAEVVPSTIFSNNQASSLSVALLNNGNWVCCYSDDNDSNKGKFVIYSKSGELIVGPEIFETGKTGYCSVAVLNSGKWVCCYGYGSNWFGNFVIFYFIRADPCKSVANYFLPN